MMFISDADNRANQKSMLAAGDIILVRTGKTGTAVVVPAEYGGANCVGLLIVRKHRRFNSTFLSYYLNSSAGMAAAATLSFGAVQAQFNTTALAAAGVPCPPRGEQNDIAAFLDQEAARIDALVAKKERLIELLREKRTALIARAVTRGLDPAVPTKDSGVDWLGEIPAHWELLALKRRARRIQTGTTPPTSEAKYYGDGIIAWYGPGSFSDDLTLQAPAKLIAESAVQDGVARVFETGSVVVVTIGATIGKVGYMEGAGSCNQQITGITFHQQHVYSKYAAYQLKSLEPVLRGIAPTTTLPIVDQREVGYLPFVIPPSAQQRAIVVFLDRETARIDDLVVKVREAIDRLKELRAALISAAVTGKIDVRGKAT